MPASDDRARFLQENYPRIQRWVHYNDAHLAFHRHFDPTLDPSHRAIEFDRFKELEALLDRSAGA